MFLPHLERPVDFHSNVDYVPSLFAYSKQPEPETGVHQKEESQKRVDERRVAEAAEREKENQRDLTNLFNREDSEEELTVHIDHIIQTESCPW